MSRSITGPVPKRHAQLACLTQVRDPPFCRSRCPLQCRKSYTFLATRPQQRKAAEFYVTKPGPRTSRSAVRAEIAPYFSSFL